MNSGGPNIVDALVKAFINPALALVFGAGLVVFIFGVVEYLWSLNVRGTASEEGKQHMFWGLVGMFIMVAAWGILRIIDGTLGTHAL